MRKSAFPTIEAATDVASKLARSTTKRLCIIADQPHDGGFTIVGPDADQTHVYINVDENGKPGEGPAALTLPIGFSGALPISPA